VELRVGDRVRVKPTTLPGYRTLLGETGTITKRFREKSSDEEYCRVHFDGHAMYTALRVDSLKKA
jgi:hypothetical protein